MNRNIILLLMAVLILAVAAGAFYFINKESAYDISNEPVLMSYSNSVYGYGLALPSSWKDKFQINSSDPDIVSFVYSGSEPNEEIFNIEVFDESGSISGKEIASKDGKVFTYSINKTNPYSGDSAEEFNKMKGQAKSIIKTFKFSQ